MWKKKKKLNLIFFRFFTIGVVGWQEISADRYMWNRKKNLQLQQDAEKKKKLNSQFMPISYNYISR